MRILIADDDGVSQLRLESLLTERGYEVVVASDGNEAWEILRSDDAPKLAILDWMMPGLDGVDVCRNVPESVGGSYTYILMLTGKTKKQDIVQGMEAGADDYLSKPFDEQELYVRLRAGQRILELQAALRIQATQDALTGLQNRGAILEILERDLGRAQRDGVPVGIVLMDLDRFKRLNDTYGHLVGDEALRESAKRMRAALRPYDGLGRYGGEEFLAVLPNCGTAELPEVAERLRSEVAGAPITGGKQLIQLTISLGATSTDQGRGFQSQVLLNVADEALYSAKRRGGNQTEVSRRLCDKAQEPVAREG